MKDPIFYNFYVEFILPSYSKGNFGSAYLSKAFYHLA